MNDKNRSNTMDTPPKVALVGAMLLCFCGLFVMQGSLNSQRGELSPTYLEPLQDAPPLLALTTQSLGGFRGIISSFLWLNVDNNVNCGAISKFF